MIDRYEKKFNIKYIPGSSDCDYSIEIEHNVSGKKFIVSNAINIRIDKILDQIVKEERNSKLLKLLY